MAAYAPVCGIAMLEFLSENDRKLEGRWDLLGGVMMFMAHDILQHQDRYMDFAHKCRTQLGVHTIIVDNSLIEVLDGSTPRPTFEDVLHASLVVKGDFTILPDVLSDCSASANATREAVEAWAKPMTGEYAYVIQGKNVMEHMAMASAYVMQLNAKMLCIPRVIANTMGSRTRTLMQIGADVKNNYEIHLLGCSNNQSDDFACARNFPGVVSIDSANPIVAGLRREDFARHHPRPKDYWSITPEELTDEQKEKILCNVTMAKSWFYAKHDAT